MYAASFSLKCPYTFYYINGILNYNVEERISMFLFKYKCIRFNKFELFIYLHIRLKKSTVFTISNDFSIKDNTENIIRAFLLYGKPTYFNCFFRNYIFVCKF